MTATYDCIATTTLSSTSNSITFSSISGSYTDLILIMNFTAAANAEIYIRYNNDSGTNYSRVYFEGNGSTVSSNTFPFANANQINILGRSGQMTNIIQIMNYANTTTFKTHLARFSSPATIVGTQVALWRSTAAITSINISNITFNSGSMFSLYGIKSE